jgi:hypothetical protein
MAARYSTSDKLAIALTCLAGIMAIILFLIEKSPASVVLLLLLMLGLSVYPILHFITGSSMRVAAFVIFGIVVVLFGWREWPRQATAVGVPKPTQIPVYAPFQTASQDNKTQLGDPERIHNTTTAYEARHENALVVWMELRKKFYLIGEDPKNSMQVDELAAAPDDWYDANYIKSQFIKAKFPPPPNRLNYPWGGIAEHMLKERATWNWIGWLRWDCDWKDDGVIFEQRFRHGWIIGVFRFQPPGSGNEGKVIIAPDNEKPFSAGTETEAPTCTPR